MKIFTTYWPLGAAAACSLILGACSYSTEPSAATLMPAPGSVMVVASHALTVSNDSIPGTFDTTWYRFRSESVQTYGNHPTIRTVTRDDSTSYTYLPYGDIAVQLDSISYGRVHLSPQWAFIPLGSKVQQHTVLFDTSYVTGSQSSPVVVHETGDVTVDFMGPVSYTVRGSGEVLQTLLTRRTMVLSTQSTDQNGPGPATPIQVETFEWYSPKYQTWVQRQVTYMYWHPTRHELVFDKRRESWMEYFVSGS